MSDQSSSGRRKYSKPAFKKVKLDAAVLLSKGCKSSEHHGKGHEPTPFSAGVDPLRGGGCRTNGFFVRNHEHGS